MDNQSEVFHNRIIKAIRSGEVICLFFPRFGRTLVLDLRFTLETPPGIIVDTMVTKPSERIERLEKMRPVLPPPDVIRIAPWFGTMQALDEAGIVDVILERCAETGYVETVEQCREAFRTLEMLETRYLKAIIRGDGARTIWQREDASL